MHELTPKTNGPKEIDTQQRASEFNYLASVPIVVLTKPTSIMMAKMAPFSTGTVLTRFLRIFPDNYLLVVTVIAR